MAQPLTKSLVFHAAIILFSILGLPYIKPDMPIMDASVPVEIMTVDEMTQTTRKPAKSEFEKPRPKDEEKKEPPKPTPPQVTSITPPRPNAPQKPEPIPVKESAPAQPDDIAPPDKEIEKKPEPKKPPEPLRRPTLVKPDAAAKTEESEAFESILRNLMPSEPTAAAQPSNAPQPGEQPSPLVSLADRMTVSEMESVRQQLAQCWNVVAGARFAEDLVVDVKLFMNQDRTVREARILDQLRYNTDSYFRAAADSTLRAVNNPRCNPLTLPPAKYEQWKVMTVRFDPREML